MPRPKLNSARTNALLAAWKQKPSPRDSSVRRRASCGVFLGKRRDGPLESGPRALHFCELCLSQGAKQRMLHDARVWGGVAKEAWKQMAT